MCYNYKIACCPLLMVLCFIITGNAQTMKWQEEDIIEIQNILGYYFDGTTNGNIEALKKAFHKDCKIYSVTDKGDLTFLDQSAFHKAVRDNYKKFKRRNLILSIDITGNTAIAKTRSDYPPFAFIDYLNILKIKDKWLIVNKTSYTVLKSSN